MPGDERPPNHRDRLTPGEVVPADALDVLRDAHLQVLGLLTGASNGTFLVEARLGERQELAIYKPRAGEAPLWDFPGGTLSRREVAAYELAAGMGWPDVPPTVLRDGPFGEGSVQLFIEHDPARHYLVLRGTRDDVFRGVAAFDVIANNADRKAGHCLLAGDGRIFLVDHGLCFHEEEKLRTVIWEFAGAPIPEDLQARVRDVAGRLRSGDLAERLEPLLAPEEIRAAADRAGALARSGRFPGPGPGRHVPWPPV